MAVKIIKHRLFTWFEDVPSPHGGEGTVRLERINHLGDEVDINDDASLERGEDLDAFYSDEEADAIRSGEFRGVTSEAVYRARAGVKPSQIDGDDSAETDGSLDVWDATDVELGDYIKENRLNVQKTLSLVPEDADLELLEKFWDAENLATDNDARRGVTDHLDARMAAVKADD